MDGDMETTPAADEYSPQDRRSFSESDVDLDNQRFSDANNSGSSSNSSLSARSLDSPNTSSLELVHQPSFYRDRRDRDRDSETPENHLRHSEAISDSPFNKIPPGWEGDSDIEIEQDPPDWTKDVPEETLSRLDRLEKKRQEVLNELCHTERLYVRKLKIMDRLFNRPIRLQQLLPADLIKVLFPNLEEILEIHDEFNASLKRRRTENPLVGDIGPVLLEMFDGDRGEQLKLAASTFCARQQIGLELLREKRKRDMKFHAFLTEAESNPVCRRLGIKDMIPTVMQRLTKYPLLFESLCKCTAADSTEYKNLLRALELSKEILHSVNLAKKEAEDEERLSEIQRKLDKSFFEKGVERTEHAYNDLRNFDFTRHKLIHDGYLMWRLQKPKGDKLKSEHQEVLLVLLEDMVVLLLKENDRYVLKNHNVGSGKAEKMPAKPLIKLNTLHATRVAADKRAFYLLSKTSPTPFMFELVCSTGEERKSWLQHITKAADEYKNRQTESRRSEVHPIPPSVTESEERNRESEATDVSGGETGGETTTSDSTTQQPEPVPASNQSIQKDASPAPETNPNNASGSGAGGADSPKSPERGVTGDGKLSVGAKGAQSVSSAAPSPAARRKQGEFLRVTESSPLIDPSEVVVETAEVHFAKIICSPYEELKRCDSKIHMAFDEKLKIISKLCHIPPEDLTVVEKEEISPDSTRKNKDAKELVAACIHQVDQLGRLIATQNVTSESLQLQKEQLSIHKVLNSLLADLLSEVHRKDEDLEQRRQELYRVREQNHGYQERLAAKAKAEACLVSPVRSPTQSRPNSFVSLSSSSDHHDFTHDDETEVVGKVPLKPQLSAPVASSSSNTSTSPCPPMNAGGEAGICSTANSSTTTCTSTTNATSSTACENVAVGELSRTPSVCVKGPERNSASDLAQEEFADALEDLVTTDWDSAVETNRESTETEVVAVQNQKPSLSSEEDTNTEQQMQQQQQVVTETSSHVEDPERKNSSSGNNTSKVPDLNGEITIATAPSSSEAVDVALDATTEKTNIDLNDGSMTNGHQPTTIEPENAKTDNKSVSVGGAGDGGENNNKSAEELPTKCNGGTVAEQIQEGTQQQS